MDKEKDNLKLIVMKSAKELGESINKILMEKRNSKESYILPIEETKFSDGNGKSNLLESVRGHDAYLISDVYNYSLTYNMRGIINHYSPTDHFDHIESTLSAIRGHDCTLTIIMPFLFASRQHKRKVKESLDCSVMLQKLDQFYNVKRLLTVDAHSQEAVVNSVPLKSYETVYPTGLILKDFLKQEKNNIDLENLIVIAPDNGAMERAEFYASAFQCPLGTFYKKRDYIHTTNGRNKIEKQIYIGPEIKDKDIIIVDDMISSGDSLLSVCEKLKALGPRKIYLISTFSLFVDGINRFKEAFNNKIFDSLYTTNYTYIDPQVKNEEWIKVVDGSDLLANLINTLNKKESISHLLDQKQEIAKMIENEKKLTIKK